MAAAVDGDGGYHAADLDFHESIIVGSDNQFLRQLVPLIANTLRVSFSLSVISMERRGLRCPCIATSPTRSSSGSPSGRKRR